MERLLYSSQEASKMCGVSRSTWCAWVRKGYAPAPIDVGGARKWPASDLEKWCKGLRKKAIDKVFE